MVVQISGDGGITGIPAVAGRVLQVVSATKTDEFTTASTSFVDITGLVATITPTLVTSKVLVMVRLGKAAGSGGGSAAFRLTRNGAAIALGAAAGTRMLASFAIAAADAAGNHAGATGVEYLDSPASVAALTYQVQGVAQGSLSAYVNRSPNGDADGAEAYRARTISTITLMEISA